MNITSLVSRGILCLGFLVLPALQICLKHRLCQNDNLFGLSVDDSDDGALDRFKTKIVVQSTGMIMWMAPKIVSSSCKFDVTYFPFDRQVNKQGIHFCWW